MIRQQPGLWKALAMDSSHARGAGRFLLWVDAVGGFWVCLGDEVVLGRSTSPMADVPLVADLATCHARIRRDSEGYLIEALRETYVDGRPVVQAALLREGSRIQLGPKVRLVFRRPHALSATARLEFASHHRTQPSVDAVLLLADACVLGPAARSHIVCPNWPTEVTLYRSEDGLYCRTSGAVEVDGRPGRDRAKVGLDSRIVGQHFAMRLEPL